MPGYSGLFRIEGQPTIEYLAATLVSPKRTAEWRRLMLKEYRDQLWDLVETRQKQSKALGE